MDEGSLDKRGEEQFKQWNKCMWKLRGLEEHEGLLKIE